MTICKPFVVLLKMNKYEMFGGGEGMGIVLTAQTCYSQLLFFRIAESETQTKE